MRHSISIDGYGFRIRPIADADAPFVLELRGDPSLNRYLHATSNKLNDQLAWLSKYYDREGDYYFVIERLNSGQLEGVISIYGIDNEKKSGEWGRWILKPGSPAAIESAWLIYRCAFEKLRLNRVYCRTAAENAAVVSFHDSCGIKKRSLLPAHFALGTQRVDAVEHEVEAAAWKEIAPRMERLAQSIARRLRHG